MDIQALKTRLDILQIAAELGIEIGRNQKAICPFHADKSPSLQFSRAKQIATCFSSNCSVGTMDVVALTQKRQGWELPETLKWLGERAGMQESSQPTATGIEVSEAERIQILTNLYATFERSFLSSKPARDYLGSRNIEHKSISVGYNTGVFHHAANLTQDREMMLQKYVSLGLLKKQGAGYSVFGKGCLVFPLRNAKRQIVSFYFRETKPEKSVQHFYLKNRQGLYPKYPDLGVKKLVLTESILDAISLKQAAPEDYEILACYGTEGYGEQLRSVMEMPALEEIVIFFDGDAPGREGAAKLAKAVLERRPELSVKSVQTPDGEDINSLAQDQLIPLIEAAQLQKNGQAKLFLSAEKRAAPISSERKNIFKTNNPNNLIYTTENAVYAIKGGLRKELDSLKVTLVVAHPETQKKSRTRLDLYEDKQAERVSREAAEKLDLRADLLAADLGLLTDLLDEYREKLFAKKAEMKAKIQPLNTAEKSEFLRFGKQQNLTESINKLIGESGVVGEEKSRLFLFVGAVSHLTAQPLNIVVQGGSGSGKSFLIKKISHLVPQQKVKRYTRLSEKSFYNFGEFDLCNHLIIIEDYDGMNEEVEYAFREIQSNGILISAVSGKEFENAEIQTKDKLVRGPIASMVATTRGEIYHDNSTRVFFISIDESLAQTEAIIAYKNQRASGEIQSQTETQATQYLQGFVRTLKPFKVKNPFLQHVRLPVPHEQLRRLHELLESFSNQITLLHQHQRKTDPSGALIADKKDMQIAVGLMFDSIILKVDELDGRLREFYEKLKTYVLSKSQNYEFSRREIRQETEVSNTQLHRFMSGLLDMEYIQQSGGHRNRGHKYKIVYWDDNQALRAKIKRDLNEQLAQM